MPYTTPISLLDIFGDTDMAMLAASEYPSVDAILLRLTVTDGDRSAYSEQEISDADFALVRIQAAIRSAEHLINSYISPRYTLPLSQDLVDTSPLPTYCNHIVRFMLMDDRTTDEVDKRYDQAMKWLRDVSMNKASLGVDDTAVASSPGRMVSRSGCSKLNWDGF